MKRSNKKKDKEKKDNHRLTVDQVDELYKSAENWTDIRQIMVNVNYYVGNQWIGWNRSERKIQTLPAQTGVERITLNKIRPRIITLLSKHIKNKLKYDVIPATKEQDDIDTAKAADRFLDFLWQDLDFSKKTEDTFLNMLIKKRCWIKTWFDSEAGDDITPVEGDPGYEEWSKGDKKPVHMGEIKARVCDPLTIFSDPAATTEEEIRWIIERKARDIDDIFEEYGVEVSADANLDYLNAYDVTKSDGAGEGMPKRDMALVYELWYAPCKKYPNGAKITKCDGQELDYNDNAGELPYTLFGYIPIPGTLTYDAIVTDMLPVQRSINIKRSMMATHAKRVGNTLWMNPIGSNVDEEELTNEVGGVVDHAPGLKPERAEAPDIPSFYDRDLEQDARDIDDLSGAREVSQGRLPSGLDTLGGLEIMVEQENEKLVVASQNYERGMKKVMQRKLRLLKKHYTEERQARILGEDKEVEIISFNGSDLTGSEDIDVVQGSSLPEMKAAQQERILLMWKSGAIVKKDGSPDHIKLLRLMGMGDSTELFEQHQLDENNAKMENMNYEEMAESQEALTIIQEYLQKLQFIQSELQKMGAPPEMIQQLIQQAMPEFPEGIPDVWDSDDDEIHIFMHNTFRKSSKYRQLPAPIRKMFDLHYQKHVDRMNAPAMAQQQAAQQAEQQQSAMEKQRMDKEMNLKEQKLHVDALNAVSKAQVAQR